MKLNFWTVTTLVFLFLFLWQWNCRGKKGPDSSTKEKIVLHEIHDTVKVKNPQPKNEVQKSIPEKVPVYVKVPVIVNGETKFITDTIWKPVDTAAILKDYYVQRDYSEEFPIDTLGVKGVVKVPTQVSENKINLQSAIFDLKVQEKKTVKTEKKAQVYLGLTGLGNKDHYGGGVDLYLKTKGNKMYGAGVKKIEGIDPLFFEGGFKMLLSFKQ